MDAKQLEEVKKHAADAVAGVEGIMKALTGSMAGLEEMLTSNPELTKQFSEAIKKSGVNEKVESAKKELSKLNNIFKK